MTPKQKPQTPQIVPRPIEALIPYARNARTHSDEQVAQLAASLREFGWTNPVLTDDEGGIIAGHGRVMAARKVLEAGATIPNWPDPSKVPTIALGHLTPAQRRAYVLADNRLALNADWDRDVLAVELDELRDAGFDLDLLGFERAELNDLIGTPNDNYGDRAGNDDTGVNYQEHFAVLVSCKDEAHQQEVFEKLQADGYEVKVLVN